MLFYEGYLFFLDCMAQTDFSLFLLWGIWGSLYYFFKSVFTRMFMTSLKVVALSSNKVTLVICFFPPLFPWK